MIQFPEKLIQFHIVTSVLHHRRHYLLGFRQRSHRNPTTTTITAAITTILLQLLRQKGKVTNTVREQRSDFKVHGAYRETSQENVPEAEV